MLILMEIFIYKLHNYVKHMVQEVVRVTLPLELMKRLEGISKSLGIKDTEYVRSLVIQDLKKLTEI